MSAKRAATFTPGDPICDVLFATKKSLRNRDRTYKEGPIEVLPGVMSNDRNFLHFKDTLSMEATRLWPETVDPSGRVSGNGVRSNFLGIRHINGYPQQPATWPLTDNRKLRADAGLSNKFEKEWHERLFRAFVRRFFDPDMEAVPMRLRKGSSSMIPFYTNKMSERISLAKYSLENASKAGELALKGNYEDAFRKYHMGGAYHGVFRDQSSDKISYDPGTDSFTPKDRLVADQEYAVTGGEKGRIFVASKSLEGVDFPVPKGFFRVRRRTAMGGPFGVNAPLMPVAQALRKALYDRYAYTFHHTSRSSQQEKINKWDWCIAADVTQHDQYWPTFILDAIKSELLSMGYAEWWVEIYVTKSHLPIYVTDVGPDQGNILLGDWRSPSLHVGLPSGNSFTDIEGALLMTFVYALVQLEHTAPEMIRTLSSDASCEQFADRYMKGELPICLLDKSDDGLLGWKEPHYIPRAKKLQEKMVNGDSVSPYMIVSYEHGFAFLGGILLYPESMDIKKMVITGNVNSFYINQFSPEYGVQSGIKDRSRVKRPFPGLAWESMDSVYGSIPIYGEAKQLIEKHWYDAFGVSYFAYREALLEMDKRRIQDYIKSNASAKGLYDLSSTDMEVLASPEKLEYKFAPSDISSSVLDMLYQGLPIEYTEPYLEAVLP